MVAIRVYVEGGGDKRGGDLACECRRGFSELFAQILPRGRMPRIVACGGRTQTFDAYRAALQQHTDDLNILLVDSEDPVVGNAWEHLVHREGWHQPEGAGHDHAHLMVQCMEAWLVADRENLARFFGPNFHAARIPHWPDLEAVTCGKLLQAMKSASQGCHRGSYDKGRHSFKILATVNAQRVQRASPHAARLFATLAQASE